MKEIYKDIKILIIGDSCKDIFVYGNVPRLAPEGPIPVFNPLMALLTNSKRETSICDLESVRV
jgi:bifunctional ADP-heptose synthase (sugar kinase/adenylyltransferase)